MSAELAGDIIFLVLPALKKMISRIWAVDD
jgi:hypothetical protein